MKILPIIVLTFFLAVGLSQAATTGRIITNGKVSMYKNGKVTSSFTQQGPIDENALIACDGTCLVKLKGVSLLANDQSKFALKEAVEDIKIYVETGKIKFTASNTSRQFVFYTPDGYIVKTEGFITPVSTDKTVKGFIQVNDKGTEIGMDQGAMVVQTREGTKTVAKGQALILAQVPPKDDDNKGAAVLKGGSGGAAAGGAGGATGGGAGGSGGGITIGGITVGTGGLVAGSVVIAAITASVLDEGYKYDLTTTATTPAPTPRPTASPNR